MIDYEVVDGVAVLTMDTPGSVNSMNHAFLDRFTECVDKVLEDDSVVGAVITSGKEHDFLAGADLNMITDLIGFDGDRAELLAEWRATNLLLRRLETGGKPVAAAINGSALGGGLEIALACHRRFVSDWGGIKLGLPESQLGMIPAAGGTQRLPRLIGLQSALMMMAEGKTVSAAQACEQGIAHEVVAESDLVSAACAWARSAGPDAAVQPWDKKGFKMPGGEVQDPHNVQLFTGANTMLHAKTGDVFPHVKALLNAVYHGCQSNIDVGLKVENTEHLGVILDPVPQRLVKTMFFGMNDLKKLRRRPEGVPATHPKRLGIVGAGLMGVGIANVASKAGLDVVVMDLDLEKAGSAIAHAKRKFDKKIAAGRATEEQRDAQLARIHPTDQSADLADCDVIIEAVFEDRAVKEKVLADISAAAPNAVIATNTSALPVTGLAVAVENPGRFIGLHFVSPVEVMPGVEVIRGEGSTDEAVAAGMDLVAAIRKVPIQIRDSRGFYGTRVFQAYVNEGMGMVAEGVNPAIVENVALQTGFGMGPLKTADTVSLALAHAGIQQAKADLGDAYVALPGHAVIERLVAEGRTGKSAGKGFYDHDENGARLWPGLGEWYPLLGTQPSPEQVSRRLLHAMALEAYKCVEEEVVGSPTEADVGSIVAGLMPAYTGGALSYIDVIGVAEFVTELEELAESVGPRFAPTDGLRAAAEAGKTLST